MSKQSRTTEAKVDKKPSSPANGQTLAETLDAPAALAEFPLGWSNAPNPPTIGGQANQLESLKFHTIQRQQMARQIGAFHGNQHLQRLAASSKSRSVSAPYQPKKESATLERAQRVAGEAYSNGHNSTPKPPPESPTTNLVSRWSFPGLDTIKEKAAEFAQDFPGYPLLTVVLGRDPIADKPVARNATNLIQGLLSLVPGGDKLFANLQKSGAIEQAYAWVQNQIAKLNLTWSKIKGLVKKALNRLEISDALNPLKAIRTKIYPVFRPLITRLKNFAVAAGQKILEFIFEGALTLAGPFASRILGVVKRAGGVFNKIIKDPIGFVGNLVKAVQKGFNQFSTNILTHLKSGLMGWLFGTLSKAGLQMPQKLNLQGLLSIVLQALGLTYNVLRRRLVKMFGEERVAKLEQVFEFIKTLATEGLAAAWQQLLSFIGSLKDMVIGAIREWVVTKIVTSAITKLVSMFNPAGAVIQAIMAIYNTIKFFIERAGQLAELANAVFESIGSIAAGSIGAAAGFIEKTMGRAIPVVLGFLARLIGLGGIGGKIKNIIRGIQVKISKAIDRFISFIAQKARKLFRRGGKAKGGKEAKTSEEFEWWEEKEPITDATGTPHTLLFRGSGSSGTLVMRSKEKVVRPWLVEQRESASDKDQPLYEKALEAYNNFVEAKNKLEAQRKVYKNLPEEKKAAQLPIMKTLEEKFHATRRTLGQSFNKLHLGGVPNKIVLALPPQKDKSFMAGWKLEHSWDREERNTKHEKNWDDDIDSELLHSYKNLGKQLGLPKERILRPNWNRTGVEMPMEVDHKAEWQLRPKGGDAYFDDPTNMELLDKKSNASSGAKLKANIEKTRKDLANKTKDQSWLYRDITFTDVEGGGSAGHRWSNKEIKDGKHLDVYKEMLADHTEPLPSPEEALEASSFEKSTWGHIEGGALKESRIQALKARHPDDAANIDRFIELKESGASYETIRKELGITPKKLKSIRRMFESIAGRDK